MDTPIRGSHEQADTEVGSIKLYVLRLPQYLLLLLPAYARSHSGMRQVICGTLILLQLLRLTQLLQLHLNTHR